MRRLDGAGIEGPLAPYAAGFARWLLNRGYKRASVDEPLGLLGLLSRWLAKAHVAQRHCAAAGVSWGGAHRLRHTLASDLLAAGVSLAQIGLVLGHRSPLVTSIYAKIDRGALTELVRAWPLPEPR